MRSAKYSKRGLSARAISGTYVVFLAFDLSAAARKGCLGFSIKRIDDTEDEEYWLQGMKTFEAVEPAPGPGVLVSTRYHPIQGFQWADYSAKARHRYRYQITAMYGSPSALRPGASVVVVIETETEKGDTHEIFFNRGAVASQEYARRFQNIKPSEIADGSAYRWLSRGLEEAIIAFIERAKGKSFSLRAAIYEFQYPSVLSAFREAAKRGVDVKIIFDDIDNATGPSKNNNAAIKTAKLKSKCVGRTNGTLMHNKFIVLSQNEKPIAVWTGSTNITENGIFGHLNVGHAINSPPVAERFFDYWMFLKSDPTTADLKDWAEQNDSLPTAGSPARKGIQVIFSPHRGIDALEWYASLAGQNKQANMITLAFGMNKVFLDVYGQRDDVLRIALLEKPGNGKGLRQGRIDIGRIRKLPNVLVAVGANVSANNFDRWLEEIDRINRNVNVRWIHTKFLLIDPLGKDPVVITGSANFSKASTETNDENLLIIRGDQRVADIYFTEFLRIYTHHAFRESLNFARTKEEKANWTPQYLEASATAWQRDYFKKGNERFLRREYYIG